MYYLLLVLLYPLSLLPLPLLYGLSNGCFFLLYRVMGYRKDIVRSNLTQAFPEKSAVEIEFVQQQFYRSFCDQWIETLKLLSMSPRSLGKRVKGNWEVFEQLSAGERDTYALLGHFFNWEWASAACQLHAPQQFSGVYLPLSSRAFDRFMQRIRTRHGGWLISMKHIRAGMMRLRGVRHIVGMMADQNPSVTEVAAWHPFMHREAPFFRGPETMARKAKGAVVFAAIRRERRGHYRVILEKRWDDASLAAPGEIVAAYVAFIERELRAQPANWLWSHRRWKHVRKT